MRKILLMIAVVCSVSSGAFSTDTSSTPQRVEVGKLKKDKPHKKHNSKKKSSPSFTKSPVNTHYHPYYFIKEVGFNGGTLSTYDETVWEIPKYNSYIAKTWGKDSSIIITPNYNWFSSHKYRLKNTLTNQSISATLSQGPYASKAIYITEINRYQGFISLSNGSQWHFTPKEAWSSPFATWKVGQAVLIGESDTWFPPDYILININENNYISVDL